MNSLLGVKQGNSKGPFSWHPKVYVHVHSLPAGGRSVKSLTWGGFLTKRKALWNAGSTQTATAITGIDQGRYKYQSKLGNPPHNKSPNVKVNEFSSFRVVSNSGPNFPAGLTKLIPVAVRKMPRMSWQPCPRVQPGFLHG